MKNHHGLSVRTFILCGFALGALLAAAGASAEPDASSGSFNLEPAALPAVVERIVGRLDQATSGRGSRLAVATFVPTGAKGDGRGEFGEYFSEALSSAVTARIKRVRLYERKRIDLVLNEQQFSVSGMVDEKQALRIGELVPIDTLLAGTYTAFDAYIDVTFRLVDISTGQIVYTETDRIKMDTGLAELIARERGGGKIVPDTVDKDPCAETERTIGALLNDLSSSEKVKGLVKAATAASFDMGCGKVHFSVMSALKRYKIYDADYRRFLLSQLPGIKFTSEDERAYAIFGYLSADNAIDDEEWKAGLETIQRAHVNNLSSFLAVLLLTRGEAERTEDYYRTAQARIAQVIALAEKNKLGLPVPATLDQAFAELLDAFNYAYTKDNRAVAWVFETLRPRLSKDEQTRAKAWALLDAMYPRESDPARKKKFLDWIIDYFKNAAADEKNAERFFHFVKDFEVTDYKKSRPEELKKYPAEHFPLLLRHPELFRTFTPLTKFPNQLAERIDVCLGNNIESPGVVPTAVEAAAMLKDADWRKRVRAAEMLVKMGPRAAPAEKALVSLFEDDEIGTGAELSVFRNNVVIVLGNIKTDRPASLELLLGALDSRDYGVAQTAAESLGKIGAPAIPFLIRGLSSDAGGVQYKSAAVLAKIGPAARAALPELRELEKSGNKDLHSIAVKAIRAIEGE